MFPDTKRWGNVPVPFAGSLITIMGNILHRHPKGFYVVEPVDLRFPPTYPTQHDLRRVLYETEEAEL